MRHHNNVKKFGRESNQRVALYRSLATNLIMHERMTTTETKAKAIRPMIEKLVTKARTAGNSQAAIRDIKAILANNEVATAKLVKEIAPKYATRPGGYTRIIKLAPRSARGDASPMAMIEFVA
jgi:large subunit ribosomal protein L17